MVRKKDTSRYECRVPEPTLALNRQPVDDNSDDITIARLSLLPAITIPATEHHRSWISITADLDSRLAYPRPRPRPFLKDLLIQDQDQDSAVSRPRPRPRLAYPRPRPRPRLQTYKSNTGNPWLDGLWQTKSHGKQKIQHTSSCTQ